MAGVFVFVSVSDFDVVFETSESEGVGLTTAGVSLTDPDMDGCEDERSGREEEEEEGV